LPIRSNKRRLRAPFVFSGPAIAPHPKYLEPQIAFETGKCSTIDSHFAADSIKTGISMTIEKRQSPRRDLKLQAVLNVDGMMPAKVRTQDIGKYGMSLVGIVVPLTAGQDVHVSFDMFHGGKLHHVSVSARISHCMMTPNEGYKAGMQFLSLDADVADLFAKYVGN
jgi:hypothetical protein